MKLFLFTNFFPYQKAEPFLVNEFQFTETFFEEITILSLYGKDNKTVISTGKNVTVLPPVFEDAGNKKAIFFKGFFNLAPMGSHVTELFSKALFFSPKKFYWFLISLLITRSAQSSKAYKDLVKKINTGDEAVLYFYWGDNLTWLIPYIAKKMDTSKVKIVVRLHGSDLYEEVKANYAPLRKHIFSLADSIVTVSENGATYLQGKYPSQAHKIKVSRLGVFDNGLNPYLKNETLTVVSAANVVGLKRLHLIFEALQQTNIKVIWHHFGSGPLIEQLKQLVLNKREGLEIKLHGHVSNAELISFYKSNGVDLFLNVSSSEGLPVSIMEALSFGIPVMATNVGGTSELVNEKVGKLLNKDFETSELAKDVEKFAGEDVTSMRENARNMFLQKVNAEKNYRNFYEVLLKK